MHQKLKTGRRGVFRLTVLFLIAGILFQPVLFPIVVLAEGENTLDETFYSGNDILFYNPAENIQSCSEASATAGTVTGPSQVGVDKQFSLGEDKRLRPVNLLIQMMGDFNLKDYQAAGVIGNFMHESGGKHLPPDVNQGGAAGPPTPVYTSGNAYGWAQWDGGRKKAFVDFSVENGYMASKTVSATDAANYAYLTHELTKTAEKAVVAPLQKSTSAAAAATVWLKVFERAGVEVPQTRIDYANEVLKAYRNGSGVSETTDTASIESPSGTAEGCENPSSAVGSADSPNFGEVAFPLKGSQSIVKNPDIFSNGDTSQGGHPYIAYDIYTPKGTEVVAFASGKVTYTSTDRCNVKFATIWNEKAKLGITYMHLSDHISTGDQVVAGDHVGTVGKGSGDPGCEVEHLHIDAATDRIRQACARTGCTIQSHFREIGKDLFNSYQALPKN